MKRFISLMLVIVMCISLTACFGANKNEVEINVYFKNSKSGELIAETIKYTGSQNTVDMANFAMKKLIEGPNDKKNERILPTNLTFKEVVVKEEMAMVDFSKAFTRFSGPTELMARFSVVQTLCDIPGITAVLITVEGKPLVSNSTGNEVGVISKKDIVLQVNPADTTDVKLYFATSNARSLKAEQRKVITLDTISIEKTIVNELIKGPSSHELISTIPSGTKLLNIETKDGVCYVNLSEEFVTKFSGGSGVLNVYSIVNSLCGTESVTSVQILIEGEKGAEFGGFVFDEPLEANMDLVVSE